MAITKHFILAVKPDNKDTQEKTDVIPSKTNKIDSSDKKEEQQKKENNMDKNQKPEKILKNEEKVEMMNAEKNNKANEKPEKVDKPEKTNKDEKKEEKGGKGPAKSPTGNGSKTVTSPDSKSKVIVKSTHRHKKHTHCEHRVTQSVAEDPVVCSMFATSHTFFHVGKVHLQTAF